MEQRHIVAYVLIGLGAITLLARLSDGAAWLWIGLLAAAALYAYRRQRTYGFLVLGCILAGTAVGILFQELLRFDGPFLISLGIGIAAIDVVEPRPNRWPRTLGAVLAILGVVIALGTGGVFASLWFPLLLIAAGVALIYRRSERARAEPPAGAEPPTASAEPVAPPPAAQSAPAAPAAPAPAAPAAAAPAAGAPSGLSTAERRDRLERWRQRTAGAEGRAPQSVIADDVLDAVAARAPASLDELAEVKGMGPVRLERYGAAMIEALAGRG